MSYLPSILVAVAGLLALVAMALRVFRGLRRFKTTLSMVMTRTQDRAGLLRARSAGVRVAFAQRRHPRGESVALGVKQIGGHSC